MPYKKKEPRIFKNKKSAKAASNIEIAEKKTLTTVAPKEGERTAFLSREMSVGVNATASSHEGEHEAIRSNKGHKGHKLAYIVGILITVAAIAGALFFLLNYEKGNAPKPDDIVDVDTTARIVVPAGHFDSKTFEYTFLKNMKAIKLTPKTDCYADVNASPDAVAKEVDAIIADLQKLEFNAIVVDTKYDQSVIYNSTVLSKTPVDLLKIITEKAKAANVNVLAVFPMSGVNKADGTLINNHISYQNKEALADAVSELTSGYEIDSVLLDGYYVEKNADAYAQYKAYDASGTLDEWLLQNTTAAIDTVAQAVKAARNAIPTGLLVKDVWANANIKEGGSKTNAEFSALINGYADTKKMVEEKDIDFVNVEIASTLENKDLPFQTVASWWGEECKKAAMPLYITHDSVNANKGGRTDQLAQQVAKSTKTPSYSGSAFAGLDSMMKNMDSSTDILLKYYRDEYSEQDLFQGLEMTAPKKRNFTVYEETVQFRGKFDPNQEVLLNGEKVVPSERGGFSVWVPLKVGKNAITLEHKGQKVTYNVERRVIIFKSVNPTKDMMVAGGGQIDFNVMAYKGSKITATLNGQTVVLEEGGGGEDNVLDSAYVNYQGSMTMPKATKDEQNIGRITFKGTYQGYSETKGGANVTIDKLPDEVDPDEATGKTFQHATVQTRYADTFAYLTTPLYPSSIPYQLPYGTQDIVQSVTGDFVNLRSGKTVKRADVSLEDKVFEGNNAITQFSAGVEGNDTVIRATFNWKAPFSVNLSPYPTDVSQTKGYSFAANTVTLLFDYTTTVAKDNFVASLEASPIFSGITHERVKNEERGIWQYKVTLSLSKAGRYYGCHSYYDGNTLVMTFNHPPQKGTLSGITIALDPGHGGTDNGTMAGSDILEKDANFALASQIKANLEALGANVIMTRNGDETVSLEQRMEFAAVNQVDLFISCHHNSAAPNPTPAGVETYFNAPFSEPLARCVQARIGQYLTNRGVKTGDSKNFFVTRDKQFPSILVENGFLSNPTEEQKIIDPQHQANMAAATAQGVLDYYNMTN